MKLPEYECLKEKFEQYIVSAAVVTAVSILLCSWNFLISPALERTAKQKENSVFLEERLKVLREFVKKGDYVDYERDLRQQIKQAESCFVSKNQFNDVVSELQSLAERKQLTVVAIRMPENRDKKSKNLPSVETYAIQLSLRGEYYDLVKFVRETENKYRITGVHIEGKKDGSVAVEMELELLVLV